MSGQMAWDGDFPGNPAGYPADHNPYAGLNREERRRLSSTPSPGSVPVTVSREIPVTILTGSDGSQTVVNHDVDEPCYACPCCALWASTVETLRASMLEHERNEHKLLGSPREDWVRCLVCQLIAGAADA